LAFDLVSSYSEGERVVIGHANGVITIDLVESLDAYRETLRVRLGEPYRTMLGHFRHAVGHYYQNVLVETGPGTGRYLAQCRELFGDERTGYSDALDRHYKFGAPEGGRKTFISEYATMHPWEDFAECFAHYLHITDSIETSREAGMVLHADRLRFSAPHDVVPLESYADAPVEQMLYECRGEELDLFAFESGHVGAAEETGEFAVGEYAVVEVGDDDFECFVAADLAENRGIYRVDRIISVASPFP
jgi:hypothetical protein